MRMVAAWLSSLGGRQYHYTIFSHSDIGLGGAGGGGAGRQFFMIYSNDIISFKLHYENIRSGVVDICLNTYATAGL
jgi:hypothetical protein